MKAPCLLFLMIGSQFAFAANAPAQTAPQAAPPAATPAAPPSAPPKRSAADLEKLVAPIALYPDPLLATMLPAAVYPLEIAQAARFVADTNNLAKLDAQPWDDNVKAVARVPDVIKKMNDNLTWTIELGEAFLAQDKDVMDAIQNLRSKAQNAGNLKTTPQQVVVVTNTVVEKTVEQKVVVVTNTVVQIVPSNPQVVYVPVYSPTVVYAPPPPAADPTAAVVSFGVGMLVGAAIANNNCDWDHGGCYNHGGAVAYNRGGNNANINVNNNVNVDRDTERNTERNAGSGERGGGASSTGSKQKWQPDQNRLSKSGSPGSTSTMQSRGWSSGGGGSSAQTGAANRASPSTGGAGARPSTGAASTRPSTGTGGGPASASSAGARPSTGTSAASRPSSSPSASPSTAKASPSASPSASSGGAFSKGGSGASARSDSSRGSSSRSSGGRSSGGGGGRSSGGGGGRGR